MNESGVGVEDGEGLVGRDLPQHGKGAVRPGYGQFVDQRRGADAEVG